MRLLTIEAQKVRVGDHIFNNTAKVPAFQWCRIVRIDQVELPRDFTATDRFPALEFMTVGWTTYKHPREGVTIRRF